MVRTGRISGCRSYALISFLDPIVIRDRLFRGVSPKVFPDTFVQPLGTSLGKSISQRLDHDGTVVVMGRFIRRTDAVDALSGGDNKRAYPVLDIVFVTGHVVSQTSMRHARSTFGLLPEHRYDDPSSLSLKHDVITLGNCREQPRNRTHANPAM